MFLLQLLQSKDGVFGLLAQTESINQNEYEEF